MANNTLIEVRIAGQNISPGSVRSKDLADVITHVENMVLSVIRQDNPEIDPDSLIVGLSDVESGSLSLLFLPSVEVYMLQAFLKIASSIEQNDYSLLPQSTIASVSELISFSKRRDCNLELRSKNGQSKYHAIITPETEIQGIILTEGDTVIYGEVVRVGGKNDPTARIEMAQGITVTCHLKKEYAQILGQRIYEWVGLRGRALWNAKTLEITRFTVEQILDYQDVPIVSAFEALSQITQGRYDELGDVDEYIAELRNDY